MGDLGEDILQAEPLVGDGPGGLGRALPLLTGNHYLGHLHVSLRLIRSFRQVFSRSRSGFLQLRLGLLLLLTFPTTSNHLAAFKKCLYFEGFKLCRDCRLLLPLEVLDVVDDLDDEGAAGAGGHLLAALQLLLRDGEPAHNTFKVRFVLVR